MLFKNIILGLEAFWGDTSSMRLIRVLIAVIFFLLWGILFVVFVLFKMGKIPYMPLGLISLLKYYTVIVVLIIQSFYIGARYLQDIYEAPGITHMFLHLLAVIFGSNIPKMKITHGQRDIKEDYNRIDEIGGPGILQIGRDNVVALETLQSQGNVLLAGERYISRFDYINSVFSTEEQYGVIDKIDTLTADGIQVRIKNVQFRFRIDGYSVLKDGFHIKDYIPYKNAVTYLAYQRPVDDKGILPMWTGAVSGMVTGVIKEQVNSTYLDDLIAPSHIKGHPLEILRNEFTLPKIHDRFKNKGIKLIACNIGEISMNTEGIDIDGERLKAWLVKQSGVLKVIRAQGEAESLVSHERGRTEGQAMLLKSIANALQDVGIKGDDAASIRKNLRNILLTRTAQILEARTSVYHKHVKEDNQNDSKRKL